MQRAEEIIELATKAKLTIATAESCTGGMVAAALTSVAGSSAVFQCGFIAYSNASKQELLGVPKSIIIKHGAVSEQVARAMAEGARARAKTDFVIGITGIAGPSGGSEEKPIGTAYIAMADKNSSRCLHYIFAGDREEIRFKATQKAMDLLYESIALPSR